MKKIFNWRYILSFFAIIIVCFTIFYTNYLAKKIKNDEKLKIEIFGKSLKAKADLLISQETDLTNSSLELTNFISSSNEEIPIIETDENEIPTGETFNIFKKNEKKDSIKILKELAIYKAKHTPIEVIINQEPLIKQKYFYGNSKLLDEVRHYPFIQLFIIGLFISFLLLSLQANNKSVQNQLWAGMAKETAHQLGTPITSLHGWVEILKENKSTEAYALEMEHDVSRLKLVSDRFGKIGSKPQLILISINKEIDEMIKYMKKRTTQKVNFQLISDNKEDTEVLLNPELIQWLFENLYKNALDAMDGEGEIVTTIQSKINKVIIDVKDNGKGMPKNIQQQIFKPGFTTKKRGWGLGLSFCKRIVEEYHQGHFYIKESEVNKGTTFRIILNK